jgi:hypothetical protein
LATGFPGGSVPTRRGTSTPWAKGTERVEDLKIYTDGELLEGYKAEAAWFWFDASTAEKKLEAGLHRLVALFLRAEVRERGLEVPSAEELYARARRKFPPDDLRPRRGRRPRPRLDNSPPPGGF